MRLATITNWAYGATVLLTLASGTTMMLASSALENERAAVQQRYQLDRLTAQLDDEVLALTAQARTFVISGDPTHLDVYRRELKALGTVEKRIAPIRDSGAVPDELLALKQAMHWAGSLHDEQQAALAAYQQGDEARARQILFGAEYEREIDRVRGQIERFQYRLDQRTGEELHAATGLARLWKAISEITLGGTALLFLGVLFFLFRQRVLRPVVRLSDVINRLAAQDYAVEPPEIDQIDEIGDMAHAIRIFRENGLERQRLEEERAFDRVWRDLISRMTERVHGCDSMRDFTDVVKRFVPEIAPGLAGRLYLFDPASNAMVEACSWFSPTHSRPQFSPLACWALRRGMPHRPSGDRVDVPCEHLDMDGETPLPDTICLPLIVQRETLGLLYLEPRAGADALERVDPYLGMIAENIGLALANLRLRDTLREMAMADPLTGLANRRQLTVTMTAQIAQAERLDQPISCLMLDVDHFKRFNDEYGHDAGDAVLREVGQTLRAFTREHGPAFRYGGEEFVLLLPGFGPEQAMARAEDVRTAIAALHTTSEGREIGAITVSIGVASAPVHCPADRIVQAADAALLRAKSAGRNRVVSAICRSDGNAIAGQMA